LGQNDSGIHELEIGNFGVKSDKIRGEGDRCRYG